MRAVIEAMLLPLLLPLRRMFQPQESAEQIGADDSFERSIADTQPAVRCIEIPRRA